MEIIVNYGGSVVYEIDERDREKAKEIAKCYWEEDRQTHMLELDITEVM